MANFKNFTKLQIIVERTDLGSDGEVGGEYIIQATFDTATPLADDDAIFLSAATPVLTTDTNAQALDKIVATFDGQTGVTAVRLGQLITITYDMTATIPVVPEAPEISNGITATYVVVDDRDSVTTLKHSEYDDSESGLSLATQALYTLVAASAVTDSAQLQRIMLSASDSELITTDITAKVVGKDYVAYTA